MEKYTLDKATDGAFLYKMLAPKFFYIFGAFALFWDVILNLLNRYKVIQLSHTNNFQLPIGETVIAIGAFSLFASIIMPICFQLLNNFFWSVAEILPISVYFEHKSQKPDYRYEKEVKLSDLKIWALKEKNAQAMDWAKTVEARTMEAKENRTNPFLLACCLLLNYYATSESSIRSIEKLLNPSFQAWFPISIVFLSILLAYISFTSIMNVEFEILNTKLKQLIEEGKE